MADTEALRVWFQSVDVDQSGSINVTELQEALAAGNLRFSQSMVAQMIRMYDRDQNGTMSFEEFVNLHKFLSLVQNAFTASSRGSGVLGLSEMHKALAQAGYALDQPSFFMACQSFDHKRTGQFRLDDFISICIYLQSARNLFDAFDTTRQGRITLDFNQFVYCGGNLRM
ncbi:sorcin [Selaginella moellendorffii]|uniref:sorcin n=1 Tax=Selaginella moellendorffii TaxID=88036 RepID=UPI000D1CACAF|nr:sorcin [Selaginella moellendorffii]|eukprot:XP_024520413.1 sorcin [Selaginella moellendorffii]